MGATSWDLSSVHSGDVGDGETEKRGGVSGESLWNSAAV